MPGKSRRRGKQSFKAKKRKERHSPQAIVPQQQAVEPAIPGEVPLPPPEMPKKLVTAPVTEIRDPFVLIELRRTGILAGIIVVILVVLDLVLT